MKSDLSTFSSMDHAFSVISENSSPDARPQRCSPMFSFKRRVVLCVTFKSMIHLELIFVSCVKFKLRVIYFSYRL